MILQSKTTGDFKPHPEGIHSAVCVDVIDLGMMETEFQGQRRLVPKLRVVFESEQRLEDGRNCTISKNFTASLHTKAKLAEFLGKWRGRPVVPGETIDLGKLIGACCTLVISHQQNMVGQIYAAIDAVSKPTKKLAPSGHYDPVAARQRLEDWKAKQAAPRAYIAPPQSAPVRAPQPAPAPRPMTPQPGYYSQPAPLPMAQPVPVPQPAQHQQPTYPQYVPAPQPQPAPVPSKSAAAPAASVGPDTSYDPEVGF